MSDFNSNLIDQIRAGHGQLTDGPFAGRPVLILTTRGARTGEKRETPLVYSRDGDDIVIVASMGGNAGTQTMTVAVRALATQDLGAVNAARVIGRETIVGLLNGLVFALIMGLIAFYWFGSGQLGVVIGAAMIINLLVAALSGILIPLGLHALDLDPAIASGVFVTMMTDCVGFFAFLGLAALWLT